MTIPSPAAAAAADHAADSHGQAGAIAAREPATRRVLVLGAGGFIGRRVMAALAVESSWRPIAATRRLPTTEIVAGCAHRAVDATDPQALRTALAEADAVVSCIAGDDATIIAHAGALAGALAMRPGLRLVYLSSMAVYGERLGLARETDPLPSGLRGYAAAKAAAEARLAELPDRVVLRPGIVYGPGARDWSGLIGDLLVGGRLGPFANGGQACCNLIHVDDVAAAVVQALQRSLATPLCLNLAAADAPSWNDYFRRYAEALGVAAPTLSPGRIRRELTLWGPLAKLGQMLLGAERLAPPLRPWLTRLCDASPELDLTALTATLGLPSIPLAEGLRETALWYRSRHQASQRLARSPTP